MSKLMRRTLAMVLAAFLLVGFSPIQARAEQIQIQKLVTIPEGAEGKEEPSDSAKTVMNFEAGTQIAVVEEMDTDWYKVLYQGNIYYVKQEKTAEYNPGYAQEELDRELEQERNEGKILAEEVERKEQEAKQTRIWVTIIVVLVLAIFGVGIYSNLSAKKAGKEDSEKKNNKNQ